MKHGTDRCAAVLFFLLLLFAAAKAEATFYLVREGQVSHLAREIDYRIDDAKAPSAFEVISRETAGWISQREKPFAGSMDPISIWVRFDVPPGIDVKRLLVNVPLWEHEELFIVRDGVLVDRQRAGTRLALNERATRVTMVPASAAGFVPVEVVPGARTTIYGHLRTENRFVTADLLYARLWDADRVLDAERRDRIVQGMFYGVLFFLIIYNLALFLVVREASFIYYVVMEVGFALTWATLPGLTFEYLSPQHPEWEFRYMWIGGTIGGFGGWQFLRSYLGTRRNFPRMDRLLMVLAYANFVVLPIVFLPISTEALQQFLLVSVPFGAAILIGVTANALRRRHPAALNLLLAMACLGLGFIAFVGAAGGWLAMSDWTVHAGQIGSALAGIVLSVGLGFRLQDERTRLARLKRFLSPKVSELIAAGKLDDPLATRRREVTIVFADLRGFTAFTETAEPEEVLGVLREYHSEIGRLVEKYEGTIEHFAGDGVMIIFNDPAPLPDAALAAVGMAVELRDSVTRLAESWRKLGHAVGCGLGVAQGYATIGTIGFPGRQDYGVIGAVCNLSARLCAQAAAGQVLVSQRVLARVEDKVVAEPVGELVLKGIQAPVPAYNVVSMKPDPAPASEERASSAVTA